MIGKVFGEFDLFKSRLSSFSELYVWLARDVSKHALRPLIVLIGLAGIFVILRAGVAALMFRVFLSVDYAFLSGQRLLPVALGIEVNIWQFCLLVWVAISVAATFGYIYYKRIFWLTGHYVTPLFARLIQTAVDPVPPGRPFASDTGDRQRLQRAIVRHSKMVMVLVRILLFSVFEMLSVIVCLTALFYLHWETTLFLLGCIVVFVPVFYVISMEGMRRRRALAQSNRDIMAGLQVLNSPDLTHLGPRDDIGRSLAHEPKIKAAFELFQMQRLVIFKSEWINGLMIAAVAALCTLWIYYIHTEWGDRISPSYIGIFLVMIYSLARSLRSLTSSNRFLDSVVFAKMCLGKPPAGPQDGITYQRRGKRGEIVELAAGDIVVVESRSAHSLTDPFILAERMTEGRRGSGGLERIALEDLSASTAKGYCPVVIVPGHSTADMTEALGTVAALQLESPCFLLVRGAVTEPMGDEAGFIRIASGKIVDDWFAAVGGRFPAKAAADVPVLDGDMTDDDLDDLV